jgi:hypothetical protein
VAPASDLCIGSERDRACNLVEQSAPRSPHQMSDWFLVARKCCALPLDRCRTLPPNRSRKRSCRSQPSPVIVNLDLAQQDRARDEAEHIADTLRSLLIQQFDGELRIVRLLRVPLGYDPHNVVAVGAGCQHC